jgi:outer membrane protein OmpA-like peptidoglycan-associated protein
MNSLIKSKFIVALVSCIILSVSATGGPYYVVIGSFSKESAARDLAECFQRTFRESAVKFDSDMKLYHVYVKESRELHDAEHFRSSLQKRNGFAHAWIHTDFQSGETTSYDESSDPITLELYNGNTVFLSSTGDAPFAIRKTRSAGKIASGNEQTPFTFVAKTINGLTIAGKVHLIGSNGRVMASFRTGERVYLSGEYGRKTLTLIYSADGYSPETKIIDLASLGAIKDVYQNSDQVWEVRFHVTRLHINKVNLMFHDLFHSDAAILKESRKTDIDLLISMLKSNPRMRIQINTHCNTGSKRSVKLRNKGQDHFEMSGAIQRSGSDKSLTKEQSETLKDYLVQQGIHGARISALGWGSIDLILKAPDSDAILHDRVEIEFVE